ncbi:hypothetical protein RYX36_021971, partial [Vicia faba]
MERRVLVERIFDLSPECDYRSLCDLWRERKWMKLLNPHCNINTTSFENSMPMLFPQKEHHFHSVPKLQEEQFISMEMQSVNSW